MIDTASVLNWINEKCCAAFNYAAMQHKVYTAAFILIR